MGMALSLFNIVHKRVASWLLKKRTIVHRYQIKVDQVEEADKVNTVFDWVYFNQSRKAKKWHLEIEMLKEALADVQLVMQDIRQEVEHQLKNTRRRFSSQDAAFKRFWQSIYSEILWSAHPEIEDILAALKTVFLQNQFTDREKLLFAISFVQNIPYRLPDNKLGLLAPETSISFKYGDCDTKALLLHLILDYWGYDCVIFLSRSYKHAMLGLSVPTKGNFKLHRGKKYYFLETTARGWQIGKLPHKYRNLNYWMVVDLKAGLG